MVFHTSLLLWRFAKCSLRPLFEDRRGRVCYSHVFLLFDPQRVLVPSVGPRSPAGVRVAGRVGGWVRWLIEVVRFVDGFAFLFLCFQGAGGITL